MFRRHQTLLPLMVAMEMQVRKGKMTNQERQLLSCDLDGLEQQLDLVLREESDEVPTWIPRKVRICYCYIRWYPHIIIV